MSSACISFTTQIGLTAAKCVRRVAALVAVLAPSVGTATPIDMNLLSRVPDAPVSISADGSQMTIREDDVNFNTLVWNIPEFDPVLIVPAVGAVLAFEYDFFRAPDNAEIFHFNLLGSGGNLLEGFGFSLMQSGFGTFSLDLSGFAGMEWLGMQFEMIPDLFLEDAGLDSTLTIANLRIESIPALPVPEPGSFGLLLAGTAALALRARRRRGSVATIGG
jgi:PEP-CTERM motif